MRTLTSPYIDKEVYDRQFYLIETNRAMQGKIVTWYDTLELPPEEKKLWNTYKSLREIQIKETDEYLDNIKQFKVQLTDDEYARRASEIALIGDLRAAYDNTGESSARIAEFA